MRQCRKCALVSPDRLDAIDGYRARRSDSLVKQIVCPTPGAGVAILLRRKQAYDGPNALAACKPLWRCLNLRLLWPANRQPHAAIAANFPIFRIGDEFNASHAHIDTLRQVFAGSFLHILNSLASQWRGLADGAFHSAQKTVRERRNDRSCGWMRLHLRTPGTQQTP